MKRYLICLIMVLAILFLLGTCKVDPFLPYIGESQEVETTLFTESNTSIGAGKNTGAEAFQYSNLTVALLDADTDQILGVEFLN
ncbi:unnamed protein product, partial [marine sediment metagenome]